MRTAIYWMKNNLISTISAVVAVASLVVIVVFVIKDGSIKESLEARKKTSSTLQSLSNGRVTVAIDNATKDFTVTVNPVVVQQVSDLNQTYADQVAALKQQVPAQNQAGHDVLLEGVLPQWSDGSDAFEFIRVYRTELAALLGDEPSPKGLPRLGAAMPRTLAEIEADVQLFAASYFGATEANLNTGDRMGNARGMAGNTASNLTAAEQEARELELQAATKQHLRDLLGNEALKTKIYAQTDPQEPGFALQMASWANASELPKPWQLFEGQMAFWIQQDLVKALGLANEDATSVLDAPVKRLINIQIDNGYTGFHTAGMVNATPIVPLASSGSNALSQLGGQALGLESSQSRNTSSNNNQTAYSAPFAGFSETVTGGLPDNFYAAPSGRISNPLYVVRQAKLTVVLDSQTGVSSLTQAINAVNDMTVVGMRFEDVDEYESMQQGFVYGDADVIRAEVVVETIWFTDWLRPYMPDQVEHYLGLEEHPEFEGTGSNGGASGFDSRMGGFDFGPMGR